MVGKKDQPKINLIAFSITRMSPMKIKKRKTEWLIEKLIRCLMNLLEKLKKDFLKSMMRMKMRVLILVNRLVKHHHKCFSLSNHKRKCQLSWMMKRMTMMNLYQRQNQCNSHLNKKWLHHPCLNRTIIKCLLHFLT